MGDSVGGARIIGTDEHFFELRPSQQDAPAFRLAEGRYFATDFEAVLGLEFEPRYAASVLSADPERTSVDYAVNLWWRRFP